MWFLAPVYGVSMDLEGAAEKRGCQEFPPIWYVSYAKLWFQKQKNKIPYYFTKFVTDFSPL